MWTKWYRVRYPFNDVEVGADDGNNTVEVFLYIAGAIVGKVAVDETLRDSTLRVFIDKEDKYVIRTFETPGGIFVAYDYTGNFPPDETNLISEHGHLSTVGKLIYGCLFSRDELRDVIASME